MIGYLLNRIREFLSGVTMVCGGFLGAQFPAFYQQYIQNLAGRFEEVAQLLTSAETRAKSYDMSLHELVKRLLNNSDPIISGEGQALSELVARHQFLSEALRGLTNAESWQQPWAFWQSWDPIIAQSVWLHFQPGVQADTATVVYGGLGAILLFTIWGIVTAPLLAANRSRHKKNEAEAISVTKAAKWARTSDRK